MKYKLTGKQLNTLYISGREAVPGFGSVRWIQPTQYPKDMCNLLLKIIDDAGR